VFVSTQEEEVCWHDVGDKAAPNLGHNSGGTVHLAQVPRAPAGKQRRGELSLPLSVSEATKIRKLRGGDA
jgi:hypothetical protein